MRKKDCEKKIAKNTGWKINVNRQVGKETNAHKGISERTAVKYLPYIDDITNKAILLDSTLSDDKNKNSMMYHSLYAYTDVLGYPALLKIKVEELFEYNKDSQSIIRRDYILQNIEEEKLSESKRFSRPHQSESFPSVNTIADLYSLVKTYDKDFHPGM